MTAAHALREVAHVCSKSQHHAFGRRWRLIAGASAPRAWSHARRCPRAQEEAEGGGQGARAERRSGTSVYQSFSKQLVDLNAGAGPLLGGLPRALPELEAGAPEGAQAAKRSRAAVGPATLVTLHEQRNPVSALWTSEAHGALVLQLCSAYELPEF